MIVDQVDGVVRVIDSVVYEVRRNSRVRFSDVVGDFQAGGTAFTWRDRTVTGNPSFEDEPINGQGEPIANTFLFCTTKVMDINPATNHTSVTYTLKGGVRNRVYPYAVQLPAENGVALYLVTFVFVQAG